MSLQELRQLIQRSIDERVPVPIEVGTDDIRKVAFGPYHANNRQATGTTADGKLVLVNFPSEANEHTGHPLVVVG